MTRAQPASPAAAGSDPRLPAWQALIDGMPDAT